MQPRYLIHRNALVLHLILWLIFSLITTNSQSQVFAGKPMFNNNGEGETFFGLTVGYSWHELGGIEATLGASISNPRTYNFSEGTLHRTHGGVSILYGADQTDFFFLFEAEYSSFNLPTDPYKRWHGHYVDNAGLEYAINFDYNQVNLRPMLGAFIFSFFNVKAGVNWGINSTPGEITYNSNDPLIGRDLAVRDGLIDKLEGLNDFGVIFGAGLGVPIWDDHGIVFMPFLDVNRYLGLSDVIRTRANNNYLQERINKTKFWQISLSLRLLL